MITPASDDPLIVAKLEQEQRLIDRLIALGDRVLLMVPWIRSSTRNCCDSVWPVPW